MSLLKDRILVIKSVNFSEADKILTVFGENFGKYTLFARGVRKIESKNRGNIQTMSFAKVTYYKGVNMGSLVESEGLFMRDFDHKEIPDLKRVLKLLNRLLPENDPSPEIFSRLMVLASKGFSSEETNKFRLFALKYLGFMPESEACIKCKEPKALEYIELSSFGKVCGDCSFKFDSEDLTLSLNDKSRYTSPKLIAALDSYVDRIINEI